MPGVVAAVAFVTAFFPVRASDDVWWHIKTGQYLLRTGEWFPAHDVFSITGADRPWVNHEWLSDILLGLLYHQVGIFGCVLAKAVFLALVFTLLYDYLYERCAHRTIAALCAIMAIQVGQFTMYLRPPVLTYGLLVAFLLVLERMRRRARIGHVLGLVAIMVPWINLHGGAILGLIAYGAYLIEALYRRGLTRDGQAPRDLPVWLGGALAVGLASLANPWGWHVHLLTLHVMRDPLLRGNIDELAPPNWYYAWMHPVMIALLLGTLVLMLLQALGAIRPTPWRIHIGEVLFSLFLLAQSWQHVRHLPLFGIVAAAPIAVGLRASADRLLAHRWRPAHAPTLVLRLACLVLGVYAFAAGALYRALPCLDHGGLVEAAHPVEACEVIQRAGLEGPIFHPINCAGYLIYALSPETMKVYTDSRFDIHGSDPLVEVLLVFTQKEELTIGDIRRDPRIRWVDRILEAPADATDEAAWSYLLDKHGINLVLSFTDSPAIARLESRPRDWVRVYYREGGHMLPTRRPWARELSQTLWGMTSVWYINGFALYVRNTPDNAEAVYRARHIDRALREQSQPPTIP